MSARLRPRPYLLLWTLLLALGVDQGVTVAHEIHSCARDDAAWVRHSGARLPACRLLPDLPDGAAALPAGAVELPGLHAWTRLSTPAERRPAPPRAVSLRSAYPRGPPA